eukprot:CAMPEP_0114566716 /NCGR_PEP_ID=MMETSP0114-20121206/15053_1 /TAXON_ID=31324 /ORGANISM="Goniomonas sp, Strain m" /LENGTH=161 /DNA_ID=CAMNT_0001753171 /DNA_START=243 /DNA_END=728 /DNA_ORIENTATION=-
MIVITLVERMPVEGPRAMAVVGHSAVVGTVRAPVSCSAVGVLQTEGGRHCHLHGLLLQVRVAVRRAVSQPDHCSSNHTDDPAHTWCHLQKSHASTEHSKDSVSSWNPYIIVHGRSERYTGNGREEDFQAVVQNLHSRLNVGLRHEGGNLDAETGEEEQASL